MGTTQQLFRDSSSEQGWLGLNNHNGEFCDAGFTVADLGPASNSDWDSYSQRRDRRSRSIGSDSRNAIQGYSQPISALRSHPALSSHHSLAEDSLATASEIPRPSSIF